MPNAHAPVTPIALQPARVFLEPTLTRDGTLDGAWWPHSTDLHRELPALVRILEDRLGPILRVRLDPAAWDEVPAHLLIDGRFLRVSGLSATSNMIRVIRGNQDGFLLLVVPPDTAGPIAAAAMRTAARTGNTMSANEILTGCRLAPAPTEGTRIRRYRDSDRESVLALIDADRLPGQPSCTPEMLHQALAGTSHRDPDPWADIEHPRIDVLVDPGSHVVGAVSYAVHRDRSAGQILWLHGGEIFDVVAALVSHALRELGGGKPVHAFTAVLGLGLAALPTGRRPVTRKALEHAGFAARNSWRYLRRGTSFDVPVTTCPLVEVVASTAPPGWWLKVHDDDSAAELVAQQPIDGLGILWWFSAADGHADPALERALLLQGEALLRENGAAETILYAAGDPEPSGALFDDAGFAEVDHLVSFTRPNNAAAD